ncbi:MAG: hypothetical protein WCK67_12610 [bacterium]
MFKVSFTNNSAQSVISKPKMQKTEANPATQQPQTNEPPKGMESYSKAIYAYSLATHSIDFENKTEKTLEKQLNASIMNKNADLLIENAQKLFQSLTNTAEQTQEIKSEATSSSISTSNSTLKAEKNGTFTFVSTNKDSGTITLGASIMSPIDQKGKLTTPQGEMIISTTAQGAKHNAIFAETAADAKTATIKAVTTLDKSGTGSFTVVGVKNHEKTSDISPCVAIPLGKIMNGNDSIVILPLSGSDNKENQGFLSIDSKNNDKNVSLKHTKSFVIAQNGSKEAVLIRTVGEFDGKIKIDKGEPSILKISGRSMKEGKDSIVAVKYDVVPISTLSGGSFEVLDTANSSQQMKTISANLQAKEK